MNFFSMMTRERVFAGPLDVDFRNAVDQAEWSAGEVTVRQHVGPIINSLREQGFTVDGENISISVKREPLGTSETELPKAA